jgi:sulfate transport system ATP-binding protein/LacI family transcriptional regulator/LacI family repressor for deo operon, udp, cdd, tsx, nupC, and nupG
MMGDSSEMSIKKIAESVGVSPATVSRVLNNPSYKCAQEDLRDRIWKAAIEMNYSPNEAARNLKTGNVKNEERTYYINVLMTRMDSEQSDPFFTELLHVIESEIHKHSCILSKVWYMSVFSDDRKCKSENLDRIIGAMYDETEGRRDGLIIIGKCNREALRKLNQSYKSIVSINRNSTNYEVDEVTCDGEKIATMAIEHLIKLGHRDIGYVGACHNEARYKGYLNTLKKHNIDIIPEYIVDTGQTEAEGYDVMLDFLKSDSSPTGFYCANDITAVGMLKCIQKFRHLRYVPSIISSDDIEEAQFTKPMLTTVRLPKDEMGRFALYILIDRIQGGHKAVVRTELEGHLMLRNSCTDVADGDWSNYCI